MKVSHFISFVIALGLFVNTASAGLSYFYDIDGGVGPGDSWPNSDAEAAEFDSAASGLGTINLIDFESPASPTSSGIVVAPGVTISSTNTQNSSVYDGISSSDHIEYGYNTTAGGEYHFGMIPALNGNTPEVIFTFDTPIQAFGAYFTGVQTAGGDVHVLFSDQDQIISGDPAGGVLFFGFTPESPITSVTIQIQGATADSRDFIGIDDIRTVNIPEPTTLILLGLSGLLLKKHK